MTENNFIPPTEAQAAPPIEPTLRRAAFDPKGVLQKNLKTFVYLGAALLVIVAALFSSTGKKTPAQGAAKGQPPQPMLQDNTDNNVQDLKNQLKAEREKQQQAACRCLILRSRLRRPRSRQPPRPMDRLALLQTAFPASPARKRVTGRPAMDKQVTCKASLRLSNSRRS